MSIGSIVSLITAGVALLINVYFLGDRNGFERGYKKGRYETLMEEFPKRILTYHNKEDD